MAAETEDDENPTGGITWLELYILYASHGGNRDEADLDEGNALRKTEQLRTQLAEFKQICKTIGRYAVDGESE